MVKNIGVVRPGYQCARYCLTHWHPNRDWNPGMLVLLGSEMELAMSAKQSLKVWYFLKEGFKCQSVFRYTTAALEGLYRAQERVDALTAYTQRALLWPIPLWKEVIAKCFSVWAELYVWRALSHLSAPVRRRYLGEKCAENSWTRRCSGDGDVVPQQQLCLWWELASKGDRNEEDPQGV